MKNYLLITLCLPVLTFAQQLTGLIEGEVLGSDSFEGVPTWINYSNEGASVVLNNGLGGTQSFSWARYNGLAVNASASAFGGYNCLQSQWPAVTNIEGFVIDPNEIYQLEFMIHNRGGDGWAGIHLFTKDRDPIGVFNETQGIRLRFMNGSGGYLVTDYWKDGAKLEDNIYGASNNPAIDYYVDGYKNTDYWIPVKILFTGAGVAEDPVVIDYYINDTFVKSGEYIIDSRGDNRLGIMNHGDDSDLPKYDNFKISTTVPVPSLPDLPINPDSDNVVVVLIDDLGWKDLGCYGSDFYETPNIDSFAETAMKFTDAYAANPLCSPTRASILTGQEPGRLRFTTPEGHSPHVVLDPEERSFAYFKNKATTPATATRLANTYITLGDVFKKLEYSTAFMGKWHLGSAPYIPENQGFDLVVGGRGNAGPPGGYFAPWTEPTLPDAPEGTHICDALTDAAIDYITDKKDDQFFLCLWYYDVHGPFEGKQDLIDKYSAKLNDSHIQRNPIMGAMVEALDQNIGRFLAKMTELGLDENTIILFASDNGGVMYETPIGDLATNNYPLRGGKSNNYEGGVRIPLIVRAPGVTTPNTTSSVVTSTVDYYPTILDLLDVPFPSEVVTTDGYSFKSALEGETYDRPPMYSTFCHRTPIAGGTPNISMRDKEWKLYRFYYDGPDTDQGNAHRYELYDLKSDISETNNLASLMPDKVNAMVALMDAHIDEAGILQSRPNQNYVGNAAAYWWGNDDTKISIVENELHIEATGTNPMVDTDLIPRYRGQLYFEFDMKSTSSGEGKLYWIYPSDDDFVDSKSTSFNVTHDGEWHEYRIPANATSNIARFAVRPGTQIGNIEIKNMRIKNADDYLLSELRLTHQPLPGGPMSVESPLVDDTDFKIFPNPVKNEVTISNSISSDIVIYSIDGKRIYEEDSQLQQHTVNVADWKQGCYIVTVQGIAGRISKIFIKE